MYIQPIQLDEIDSLKGNVSIFNSRKWLSVFEEDKLKLHGIFNKNKELIGCFYFYIHKRAKFLTHLSPPPFTPHSGFYIEDKTENPSQKKTFFKKVQQTIVAYLKNQKYDFLALTFSPEIKDVQGFIWNKYSVENRYTYQLDLNKTEEELLRNMSSERRKNINKANKDGITCELVKDKMEIEELIYSTFNDQNIKVNKAVLSKLLNLLACPELCFAFVSYDTNKKALACSFFVYDKKQIYYLLGGYSKEIKHEGAGALSMWNGIMEAKRKGIEIFDFEGSMIQSVEKYFRGFGGDLMPYFSIVDTNFIAKSFTLLRKIF